jgi:hypothetical protein
MLKLPKRYTIKEIAEETGLEKSAVRFYIQEVLPDYVAKHCGDIQVQERKATLYPQEILERIKFIKMVKTELSDASNNRLKPTIRELRGWMNNISDEQVRDVVEGKDSIAFGVPIESKGIRQIETLAGERLSEDSRKYGAQIPAFSRAPEENSAAEYLAEIMPSAHKPRAQRKPQARTKQLKLGPDLEIHYPGNLSAKKEKQLKLAGELLRSIVTEED